MLLYKDIISGDEMVSDAFQINEVDDIIFEVDCKMIVVKEGEVDIGANASAEEPAEEELEDGAKTVNNLVHSMRLQSTSFDKKSYMSYIKGYMKAVKAHLAATNPDRVPIFEEKAKAMVVKILGNINDYEFYVGESMNPDGTIALLNYREDGITPFFTFFKDGLIVEKI
ncbi:translationally controlled tumor protein [Entophlyctis helioformis]|nr:translationally controlled tumor protein [Entophlyctis helioformis]